MEKILEWCKEFGGNAVNITLWLVKQFLGKEKLSQKIIVDSCSGSRAVSINCGDPANIRVWVSIRNYTAFSQKLDNLVVIYHDANISIKLRPDSTHTIAPFSEKKIYLDDNIIAEHAQKFALSDNRGIGPRIEYHADFSNRLYELQKHGNLECISVEKLNDQMHKKLAESKKSA